MTGMFPSLDVFVLSCLFVTVKSQTGQILPPQNVSLQWINDFEPQLSWAPPEHSVKNCTYVVISNTSETDSESTDTVRQLPWREQIVMEGGFLILSVQTCCNDILSEPVFVNVTYPDLVENLQCHIYTSNRSQCSWDPGSHAANVSFFYWIANKSGINPSPFQECSLYSYTDGIRTGCNLKAKINQRIYISFNTTLNNILVRNTFKRNFIARPPALNWTVKKTGDRFIINWDFPDILYLSRWKFTVNYTECKDVKSKDIIGKTSTELHLIPHCTYSMAIKAQRRGTEEETPWSKEIYFDADEEPNMLVYAAIIIPLMIAGLALLTLVCYRKNKEKVFPKVPKPLDLLSDIPDNNNKSNLYIPAEEEENCKITLVIDPQTNKVYS